MSSEELRAFGTKLRTAREALDQSLADVETATRIRTKFLQGLENGDTDPSLTPMQVNGFLRNYARHLRLNPDEIVVEYEQAKNAINRRSLFKRKTTQIPAVAITNTVPTPVVPQKPVTAPVSQSSQLPPEEKTPLWRQLLRTILYLMAALGFMALAGAGTVLVLSSLTEQNNAPSENVVNPPLVNDPANLSELQSPTPTLTPSPTATPPVGFVMPPAGNTVPVDGLVMFINARARSWVEVQVDGVVQFRGLLRPGTGVQYQAQESILLVTANAGGLEVILNNQPLGTLGEQGAAFQQTFTLSGLITPTVPPPATLTPSFTPTELPPGQPSSTPTPTSTASLDPANAGIQIFTPTVMPTLTSMNLLDENGNPVVTQPPSPMAIPPTVGLPTTTPTMTPSPTITVPPSPVLPDRMTRTPRPS